MADPRLPFGFGLPPELMAAVPPLQGPSQMAMQPSGMPDLSNVPAFGQRGFEAGVNEFAPEIMAEAMPFMLGPVAGRAMQMAPKTTAGIASLLMAPSQAGSQPSDTVKQLQIKLRDAGYYDGNIDGQMKGKTKAALAAFEAAELERQRIKTEQEKIAGEKAATDLAAEKEATRTQERAAGEERFRQAEENVPAWRRALREYGPPLGYAFGLGAGVLTRGKIKGGAERHSAAAAQKADDLMRAPPTDVPGRVGRVNQFWDEGGAGTRVPFQPAPGTPRGFASNPDAAPAASLYRPPGVLGGRATGGDALAAGGFGVETGIMSYLGSNAQQRLDEAEKRVRDDPTEANIRSLQSIKDQVAFFDFAARAGQAGLGGYGLSMAKSSPTYSRPNVSAAEASRIRIDQLLGRDQAAATAAPSAPLGAPAIRPHHSQNQPRNRGRFAGPPGRP